MTIYPNDQQMKSIYQKAVSYAQASIDYTFNYDGFKGEEREKRINQITTGRLGQLWFYEVCELNGIPFIPDYTSHKESDKFDVIVYEWSFDVKTTRGGAIPFQVASHLRNQAVDYYCFLETSSYELSENTRVNPLGIITKTDFWQYCISVPKGALIPETSTINKFKETNILSPQNRYRVQSIETVLYNLHLRKIISSESDCLIELAMDAQRIATNPKKREVDLTFFAGSIGVIIEKLHRLKNIW